MQALQAKQDPSNQAPTSDLVGSVTAASPVSERRPSFNFASHPGSHSPLATASRSRRQSVTSPQPVRSLPVGYQLSHSISSEQENAIVSPSTGNSGLPTPTSTVSGFARDEIAFYQAEVQALSRENQILKARIRELGRFHECEDLRQQLLILIERQSSAPQSPAVATSVPHLSSHLSTEQSISEEDIGSENAK